MATKDTEKKPPRSLAIATVKLESITPYSQSRAFQSEKEKSEDHDAFDARCWREHLHTDEGGYVYIPPMQFKNAIDSASNRVAMKIEKKGLRQFVEPGVMVLSPVGLGIASDTVACEKLFMTADGKPASKSTSGRVWRRFPVIPRWSGNLEVHVIDDRIGEHHLRAILKEAGNLVGVGRWRPEKRGINGRFKVVDFKWAEM